MTTIWQLTYAEVFLVVFANQICLPVPSVVLLMAAGAISARGGMRASIVTMVAVLGCLAADWLWFWFGRRWGTQAMRLLCRFAPDPRKCSRNAHEAFRRYGLPVLCVAKFFPGVDGMLPPLAGAQGVSPAVFLFLDAAGSLLWAASYVGLGYIFSNQLDLATGWAQRFGTTLAIAIGVPAAIYSGWRGLALIQMIRRLRVRRISSSMLDRKLKSKSKIAMLDLLDFELETEGDSPEAIPGAFRVDPSVLRNSPHIVVPDDVQVILYSSSGRDSVCARAAVGLNRIGIDNVWVLEGGLKAWRDQGFPISKALEKPEVIAGRLGVKLPAR